MGGLDVSRLRSSAPGLYSLLTAYARKVYGKGLNELSMGELLDLAEKATRNKFLARILRVLVKESSGGSSSGGGGGGGRMPFPMRLAMGILY